MIVCERPGGTEMGTWFYGEGCGILDRKEGAPVKAKLYRTLFHPLGMAVVGLLTGVAVKLLDVYCYAQHFGVSLGIFSPRQECGWSSGWPSAYTAPPPGEPWWTCPFSARDAADLLYDRGNDWGRLWVELYLVLGGVCLPLPFPGVPGPADPAARGPGAGPEAGGVRGLCGDEFVFGYFLHYYDLPFLAILVYLLFLKKWRKPEA